MNSAARSESPRLLFPSPGKRPKCEMEAFLVSDAEDETWVGRQGPSTEEELWDVPPEAITTSGTMVSEAKRGPPEPRPLPPGRSSPRLWGGSKRVGRRTVEGLTTGRRVRPLSKLEDPGNGHNTWEAEN